MRDRKVLEIVCGLRKMEKDFCNVGIFGAATGVARAIAFITNEIMYEAEKTEKRRKDRAERVARPTAATRRAVAKAGKAEFMYKKNGGQ